MFSNKDKTDKPDEGSGGERSDASARPAAKSTIPSLISADLNVTGNLQTDGEIQIDGNVEGDVTCKKLMVGDTAVISGEIKADEVEVRGRVQGRIRSRSVLLTKSAHVVGEVWHDSLSIEAGAFLDGHCKRNDSAAPKEVARPRAQTKPPENTAQADTSAHPAEDTPPPC